MGNARNLFGAVGGFIADAAEKASEAASGAAEAAGKAAGKAATGAGAVAGVAAKAAGDAGKAVGGVAIAVAETASGAAETAFTAFGGSAGKMHISSLKDEEGRYVLPDPIVDEREAGELVELTEKYESLTKPNQALQLVQNAGNTVVKGATKAAAIIGKDDLYEQSLGVISKGFEIVRDQANVISASEDYVLSGINSQLEGVSVSEISEIRLLRSYDVAKIAKGQRKQHLALAFSEGAATGAPGLPGIPFNLVLSTFLFYRAVQSIAMFYGYNVKEDPSELEIAGDVLMGAMSIGQAEDPAAADADSAATSQITKLMMLSEIATVKQTVKKGWAEMAKKGGACLLVAQIRAMGNAGVRKTVQNAGAKSLEAHMFKGLFEQVGKKLTQDVVSRAVPIVGGVTGAVFDTAQMNTILKYADLFYHKRFIVEKELRVNALVEGRAVDDYLEVEEGFEVSIEDADAREGGEQN